ncbi:hypothetical protein HYH03_012706 [Edaphochlamys debaryana]|uniref:Uncharacterized protein n=1 Tax=Edaphochlamys debaryana TaxID=47281 RepID=A0A835XUT7_9CHLO|nr:hypothetical protein HYH03_012706 [Edaphochlamys debaryana]|eukprot:KAG2488706.1 hypothetical protein HYH03_012706 [Edaphochlamys debaryana]
MMWRRLGLAPSLALVLLSLAALPGRVASKPRGGAGTRASPTGQPPLTDSDLVLVRGTTPERLDLAHATARAGRIDIDAEVASIKGKQLPKLKPQLLRTVYVLHNDSVAEKLQQRFGLTMNETYLSWPDRKDPRRPGDSRVALAPWLAHKALGDTYKWILFGDDDTYFFLDGVKYLLRDYDPDLPYVVTDMLVHKGRGQMMEAPRCLPCHVTPAFRAFVAARPEAEGDPGKDTWHYTEPPVPPAGCPCTPDLACEWHLNVTGKQGEARKRSGPFAWNYETKRWGVAPGYPTKCDYPGFHGGFGVLMSVGAMRKVSYEAALDCFYDDPVKLTQEPMSYKEKGHGDKLASHCFWINGVAITDPGTSLSKRELTNSASRAMDSRSATVEALEMAVRGEAPAHWLWSVVYMASAHVQHHGKAVPLTWKMGRLYGEARQLAIAALQRLGQWGRGVLDAQVDPSGGWGWRGQPWEREAWDRAGDAEWKRGANFSEALGGEGEGRDGGKEVEEEDEAEEEGGEEKKEPDEGGGTRVEEGEEEEGEEEVLKGGKERGDEAAAAAPKRRAPLTDSDMVLVKPTVPSRLELAHATMRAGRGEDVASGSPSARQALRAVYVMSNASLAQELQASQGGQDFRRPGDSRVALAPWLAHKALGDTYKWILFGDDDTYFFLDGVKHLLRDYDPDLPYVVTDLVVHKGTAFHSDAPRCLPCHVTPAFRAFVAARPDAPGIGSGKEEDENPRYTEAPVPPSGCPCTPDLACEWHLNVTGQRHLLNRTAPLSSLAASRGAMDQDNPTNCQFPGFHGGYGVLISVGAMRKVSYEAALECFYDDLNSFTATSYWKAKGHGDQLTSGCFWRHGVALTDPGISLTHRSTTNGASRVMNSRTANVESLEKLLAGELPAHWLWNFILMAGSHVQHHGKSVPMTWKLGKLYRQGFPYAVAALKRLGQWGRGVQDAQVDPSGGWGWRGQPWEREAWDRAGDAEWKRGANFSEAEAAGAGAPAVF